MALIKCSECGNAVSSRATVCPQCGCPINDSFTALQAVVNNSRNKIYIILFVSLGILLVGVLGWKVSNTIEKDNIIQIGKVIQDCEEVYPFKEGLALVCQNGKYGFISKKGEMVIPCKYELATDFSEGLAVVRLGGKYGYVNKQGVDTFSKQKGDYEEVKLQEESQNQISMINNLIKDKATFKGYGANGYLIFSPRNDRGGRARIVITLASQYDYIYDITEDGRILLHDGTWYKGMSQPEKADNEELFFDENQQGFYYYYGGDKRYYKLTQEKVYDEFYKF